MRKLVLVITDGEPSDVDVTDSESAGCQTCY